MAVTVSTIKTGRLSITGTGQFDISDVVKGTVGRLAVQISGSATYSLTFEGRVNTGNLTASDNVTISYTTPSSSTLAATAITSNGIYYPIGDGLVVGGNLSANNGTVVLDVLALLG